MLKAPGRALQGREPRPAGRRLEGEASSPARAVRQPSSPRRVPAGARSGRRPARSGWSPPVSTPSPSRPTRSSWRAGRRSGRSRSPTRRMASWRRTAATPSWPSMPSPATPTRPAGASTRTPLPQPALQLRPRRLLAGGGPPDPTDQAVPAEAAGADPRAAGVPGSLTLLKPVRFAAVSISRGALTPTLSQGERVGVRAIKEMSARRTGMELDFSRTALDPAEPSVTVGATQQPRGRSRSWTSSPGRWLPGWCSRSRPLGC